MREDLRRTDHVRVVVQRLALPLEHRAGDDARRFVAHGDELGDDLPRLEIARKPEAARRTEIATHGAAGLRGETHGEAPFAFERNAHRLRECAVVQPKQVLDESVARIGRALDDLQSPTVNMLINRLLDRTRHGTRRGISLAAVGDGMRDDPPRLRVADVGPARAQVRGEIFR